MKKKSKNVKTNSNNYWIILGLILIACTLISIIGVTNFSRKHIEIEGSSQNISAGQTAQVGLKELSDSTLHGIFKQSNFYIPVGNKNVTISLYWKYFTKDGDWVYCIQLGVSAGISVGSYAGRTTVSPTSDDYWKSLSKDKQDLIELLTVYGYPNVKRDSLVTSGDKGEYQYMATQVLIWEVQQGWRTKSGRTGNTLYDKYIKNNASLKSVYEAIEKDVKNHSVKPSFARDVNNPSLEYMKYNESSKQYSLTLTDTNGVLGNYKIDCRNVTCKVDGNKLVLSSTNKVDMNDITFTRKIPNGISQAFLVLKSGEKQKMVIGRATLTAPQYYVTVSTKDAVKGTLTIKKTSDDGVLEGFEFKVTSILNGYSKTVRTGADGTVTISDLKTGIYEITEINVPDRYVKPAISMQVATFSESKTTSTVTFHNVLKDTKGLKVIKIDAETNQPIAGAELCLTGVNKKGSCLLAEESWTSTDTYYTSKKASNLIVNHEYYICEKKAPAGYDIADCQPFKLTSKNQLITIEFKNTKKQEKPTERSIVVSKKTSDSSLIGGAKLKLLTESGDLVTSWTTENGKTKTIPVNPGKYILVEEEPPAGYVKAANKTITVNENDNSVNIEMIDDPTKVVFSKISATGSDEIEGAHLQVIDSSNKVIEEWDSVAGKTHIIEKKLVYGKTYTLKETQAPYGYVISEAVQFTVGENSSNKVVMKNQLTEVRISKRDTVSNKFVAGAHLQLLDDSGNVVSDFYTEDKEQVITGLPTGVKFTLKEIETPQNYLEAADVEFEINPTEKVKEVPMFDTPIIPDIPNTAADASVVTVIAGSILVIFGIGTVIWLRRRKA